MSNAQKVERVLQLARARRYSDNGEGKRRRLQHELALQDVADAIGSSPPTVWRWEHGRCRPSGDAAVRWVQLLDDLDLQAAAS